MERLTKISKKLVKNYDDSSNDMLENEEANGEEDELDQWRKTNISLLDQHNELKKKAEARKESRN